jgi:hypothetical protein
MTRTWSISFSCRMRSAAVKVCAGGTSSLILRVCRCQKPRTKRYLGARLALVSFAPNLAQWKSEEETWPLESWWLPHSLTYVTCVESGELIQRNAATASRISISTRTTSFNICFAPLACRLSSCTIVGIFTRRLLEPPTPVQSLCLRQVALPALRREAAAWDLAQMEAICPCRRNNRCLEHLFTLLLLLVRLLHRAVLCRNRT